LFSFDFSFAHPLWMYGRYLAFCYPCHTPGQACRHGSYQKGSATVEQTLILTGTQAAAEAARLSRVQVVAAYPITPQSKIPEILSGYVERGDLKAELVRVESEHSAMGVCIAASIVGARAFTATAANGLAYMHEQLHWAAGARLPLVMFPGQHLTTRHRLDAILLYE
jgi:hypothetical protein